MSQQSLDATPLIFHYCPAQSFFGIVQDREIWMSRADFSNDAKECSVLTSYLEEKIRDMLSGYEDRVNFSHRIVDLLRNNNRSSFIASFSYKKDALSQWRGYADFGKGFALGFTLEDIQKSIDSFKKCEVPTSTKRFVIAPQNIKYDIDITDLSEQMLDKIKAITYCDNDIASILEIILPDFVKAKTFYYKDASFSEEEEFRVSCYLINQIIGKEIQRPEFINEEPKVRFRCSANGNIIPYYALPLYNISSVIRGPKNEMTEAQIYHFLHMHGFNRTVVRLSGSSFR